MPVEDFTTHKDTLISIRDAKEGGPNVGRDVNQSEHQVSRFDSRPEATSCNPGVVVQEQPEIV